MFVDITLYNNNKNATLHSTTCIENCFTGANGLKASNLKARVPHGWQQSNKIFKMSEHPSVWDAIPNSALSTLRFSIQSSVLVDCTSCPWLDLKRCLRFQNKSPTGVRWWRLFLLVQREYELFLENLQSKDGEAFFYSTSETKRNSGFAKPKEAPLMEFYQSISRPPGSHKPLKEDVTLSLPLHLHTTGYLSIQALTTQVWWQC